MDKPSLDRLPTDPTPDEIRELCRQIQAGWDAQTERQRRVSVNPLPKLRPSGEFSDCLP